MRPDMSKVIVERPRRGGRGEEKYGRGPARDRADPESAPIRAPMRDKRMRTKELNEHLQPLWRFLDKQVGRPWNKVKEEMHERISMRNAVQKHILDHVKNHVEEHPVMIDGVPYQGYEFLYGAPRPLRAGGLYVCPKTGLLRAAKKSRASVPKPIPVKRIDNGHCAVFLKGCWHEATMGDVLMDPLVPTRMAVLTDAVLGYNWDTARLKAFYGEVRGRAQYAVSLRPMRRAEIRNLP